jgi:hypothetical protein
MTEAQPQLPLQKPKIKWVRWSVAILAALFLLQFIYSSVWFSSEIRGRVTQEDGKPIQGAIVMLVWMLKSDGMGHYPLGPLAIDEALTDANGKFVIAGWGPRFSFSGHLDDGEPQTFVFHHGYAPIVQYNNPIGRANYTGRTPRFVKFHMHGQTFQLKRFDGTAEERVEVMRNFSSATSSLPWSGNCVWKNIPKMLNALRKLELSVRSKTDMFNRILDIDNFERNVSMQVERKQCADKEAFLKEYLK